jgi:phosphate transport system substrate-binding protein
MKPPYAGRMKHLTVLTLAASLGAFVLSPALAATQLTGAGSSFVFPYFSRAFYDYGKQHSDVTINYQPIGSGGGIQQFTQRTVDFGASDVPMNADEIKRLPAPAVQLPVALGGVAITYNFPSLVKGGLKLSRETLAEIYLGKITKWNDPALAKLNPGTELPDMSIVVVHRSDASGTTYIFTDFLSHVSRDWKAVAGTAKSVAWPAASAVGGKGNEGVAGQVRQTPGAIGYVELAYVHENHMTQAQLQNASGHFTFCTGRGVAAAAASKPNLSATDFSIVDAKSDNAWPIAGYTWAFMYREPADKARGKIVHDVLLWAATSGQATAATLDYVALPDGVQEVARKALADVKV